VLDYFLTRITPASYDDDQYGELSTYLRAAARGPAPTRS